MWPVSPPQLPQGLAELGVVQVGVLIGQLPSGRLRPHHEGVHGPLHVRLALVAVVDADRHGHQRPVVAVQHLAHRLSDADGEAVILLVRLHGRPALGGGIAQSAQEGLLAWRRRVASARGARRVARRQGVAVIRDPRTQVHVGQTLVLSRHGQGTPGGTWGGFESVC